MTDCLFCSIVAGDVPSTTVLDAGRVYAFRDVAPAAPVHVLIVPKEHVAGIDEVTEAHGAMLAELVTTAQGIAATEGIDRSGYRLVFNVGPDSGQAVFHLHLHLLGGAPLGRIAATG